MTKVALKEFIKTNTQSYQKSDNWNYINYLDTGNLTENYINGIICFDPIKDKIPSRAKRKVKIGDILYSTVRPNQKHYGYIESFYDNLLVSTGFVVIEPNKSKVNGKYLYYYLTQNDVITYLQTIAENTVATYPSISPKDIENLMVDFPTPSHQDKIVHILSNYDDLIENNNRRIKILEEMAQKIYTEWFVDFKFPGHETATFKDSELGKIPSDWGINTIDKWYNTSSGGTPSRKNEEFYIKGTINWVKTGELKNTFVIETEEKITEEAIKHSSAKIFPQNTVVLAMYCGMGDISIMSKPMSTNQACCIFLPKYDYLKAPFTYLFFNNITNDMTNISFGAAQQNLSQEVIKSYIVKFPDEKTITIFTKYIHELFEQMKMLLIKNETLKQTRDILLQRLISGEIDVENLEII